MASKLIELEDGTLVEVEVPENKAKPISGGVADKIKDATIDRIKPIILKEIRDAKGNVVFQETTRTIRRKMRSAQ